MAGELGESDVNGGEHHHWCHHHRRERDEDDRLIPLHRRRAVDRVVADDEACHDQHASEEAEDDLGQDGPAGLGCECDRYDGHESVPKPDRCDAGCGVAVGGLPANRACPDGEKRGHGEVEDLEWAGGFPEGFEQRKAPSFC